MHCVHACAVQGNCKAKPSGEFLRRTPGAGLLNVKPQQCVILANQPILPISEAQVWVDNLLFRYSLGGIGTEAASTLKPPALLHVHSGHVYATNMSIQGDGRSHSAAYLVLPTARSLMIGAPPASACMCGMHGCAAACMHALYARA
jgi:hypothetical protein